MSLAPTLSHALQDRAAPGWLEVCTAQGAKWVETTGHAADEVPDPRAAPTHVFEHCPYCSLHASDIGLTTVTTVMAVVPLRLEVPRLFLAAPRTLHA